MTDYSSEGAVPIDDAASDHPPTVDEVLEEQRRRDDLPDPEPDPAHQQVIADLEPDAASADDTVGNIDDDDRLRQLLIDEAIANDTPPPADPAE